MQEQFSYSLMASGMGILIVFAILVLLSVLMIVIRKLSDTDTVKPAQPGKVAKGKATAGIPLPVLVAVATAASTAEVGTPNWLAAATAAFLATEDDDAVTPRASNWANGGSNKFDPWVNNNKLSKTAPGA